MNVRTLTLVLAALVLAACSKSEISKPFTSEPDFFTQGSLNNLQAKIDEANARIIINTTSCIGIEDLPKEMFSSLPEFPRNFYGIKVLYDSGTLTDLDNITENYWKQPCWLPNWNHYLDSIKNPPKDCFLAPLNNGTIIRAYVIVRNKEKAEEWRIQPETHVTSIVDNIVTLKHGNTTTKIDTTQREILLCAFRRGAYGYGISPAQTVIDTYPGANFDIVTRVYAGPIVETYQTLAFKTTFRSRAAIDSIYSFADRSKTVNQDPEKAQKYIRADITPKWILLEPAYPIMKNGWAQNINIHINISEQIPCGHYAVGIEITPIDNKKFKELARQYTTSIVQAGIAGIDRPWYEAFLDVQCEVF